MHARKVLLPFDGSPAAHRALEFVAAERGPGTHVHVLNVQAPTIDDEVYLAPLLSEAEQVLLAASRYLERMAVDHTTRVVVGFPRDTIVRSATEEGCTEIVMGMRGAVARFLSGSVSATSCVARQSP
jgi:nucleotide-binding universal stress UspA family protein